MLSTNKIYSKVLRTMGPYIGARLRKNYYRVNNPFFIVGTGRCGSTLLVNILNSHPKIRGYPGEANKLWHPEFFPAGKKIEPIEADPKGYTAKSLSCWPAHHGDTIRDTFSLYSYIAGEGTRFFVKSAMISFMIPQILLLYPKAKFIHLYRNAPSVVDSYVKKNYGKYENYHYSKEDYYKLCAKYWNECIHEIERAKNEYKLERENQFLEFSYEQLCANPEMIVEKIANFFDVNKAKFTFDLSEISNKNYKINDMRRADLIESQAASGMQLKGYPLNSST